MRPRTLRLSALLALMICGSCLAGSTLYTWAGGRQLRKCTFSRVAYVKHLVGVVFMDKTPAKPSEDAAVGVLETPEIVPSKPFTEVVPSWNAYTPDSAYLIVMAKVRIDGTWTRWYQMELYNVSDKPEPKKSFGDSDEIVNCPNDTLVIKNGKSADAVKVRYELRSTDGKTYPMLRFISVNVNDPVGWKEDIPSIKSVWGKELDVPYLCQLSVKGGGVWCSPTSTAIVLGYWAKKLNRPEMAVGITECAGGCFDHRWGGTGHWSFNTVNGGAKNVRCAD